MQRAVRIIRGAETEPLSINEDPGAENSVIRLNGLLSRPHDLTSLASELLEIATRQRVSCETLLVREPRMRVLLIAMPEDRSLPGKDLPGPACLLVLRGQLLVHREGGAVEVNAEQLLTLQAGTCYSLEAICDSVLLLTMEGVTDETNLPGPRAEKVGEPW
jgi:quercetin dioxygenase-like cupin family protein